jgi:hypothetical protein
MRDRQTHYAYSPITAEHSNVCVFSFIALAKAYLVLGINKDVYMEQWKRVFETAPPLIIQLQHQEKLNGFSDDTSETTQQLMKCVSLSMRRSLAGTCFFLGSPAREREDVTKVAHFYRNGRPLLFYILPRHTRQ